MLLSTVDGSVHAFNAKSGKLRWTMSSGGPVPEHSLLPTWEHTRLSRICSMRRPLSQRHPEILPGIVTFDHSRVFGFGLYTLSLIFFLGTAAEHPTKRSSSIGASFRFESSTPESLVRLLGLWDVGEHRAFRRRSHRALRRVIQSESIRLDISDVRLRVVFWYSHRLFDAVSVARAWPMLARPSTLQTQNPCSLSRPRDHADYKGIS